MDWFRRTVDSIRNAWSGFPAGTRVLAGILLVLFSIVAAWGVFSAPGDPSWVRIVDMKLTMDQRGEVGKRLRDLGIKFKVEGDAISVPPERADEAMLQLQSALGDEAFFRFLKESDLFGTRDKHDRQWLVATQARLAAMIQKFDFVRTAHVQLSELADPKSLWWHNGRETTAAVILEPATNKVVTPAGARAIASLVAGAIAGLKPSSVKIVDSSGRFFQVSESPTGLAGDQLEYELAAAASIENKVRNILPFNSRVSAQVRVGSEKRRGEIEAISVAVLVPEDSIEVPPAGADRKRYEETLGVAVRAAAGATLSDAVVIRIAPIELARVTGVAPVEALPAPASGWSSQAPLALLILLGAALLAGGFRLVRGMAPVKEEGVVAEESLRAPGESILSAQDEALDRIRDGVRETVSRHPREAADVARRWLAP